MIPHLVGPGVRSGRRGRPRLIARAPQNATQLFPLPGNRVLEAVERRLPIRGARRCGAFRPHRPLAFPAGRRLGVPKDWTTFAEEPPRIGRKGRCTVRDRCAAKPMERLGDKRPIELPAKGISFDQKAPAPFAGSLPGDRRQGTGTSQAAVGDRHVPSAGTWSQAPRVSRPGAARYGDRQLVASWSVMGTGTFWGAAWGAAGGVGARAQ